MPSEPETRTLREALLDIGADHEGHALKVVRSDGDDFGPPFWLLVCDTDDESNALLDFAELERTALAVPSESSDPGLLAAVTEFLNVWRRTTIHEPSMSGTRHSIPPANVQIISEAVIALANALIESRSVPASREAGQKGVTEEQNEWFKKGWRASTQSRREAGLDAERVRYARAVAESWRDQYLATIKSEGTTIPWAVGTHPLSLVIAALDGETDPRELGMDEEDLAARLAATSPSTGGD